MGDRYFLTVTCPKCGSYDDNVYYAPTCNFVEWTCPDCKHVVGLEELTGISYDDASNAAKIETLIENLAKESENMKITFNAEYYKTKTDAELDVLVAEAAGLELRILGGEGGWVDKDGVLIHLESEFHPSSKANYSLDLFREVSAEGNGLAINTADATTKIPGILIGGFPFDGEKELPILFTEIEDMNDFGEFRKTLLRSFCIFYIMYKNSREG